MWLHIQSKIVYFQQFTLPSSHSRMCNARSIGFGKITNILVQIDVIYYNNDNQGLYSTENN
jgi:hypothetical protein